MKIIPTPERRKEIREKVMELAYLALILEILLVAAFALACRYDIIKAEGEKLILPVSAKEKEQEVVPEQPKKDRIDEISDIIWLKESTRGKHNYSKCEAIGEVNGIGYGIPGNGSYQCFKDHAEEMKTLRKWIVDHQNQGMSEKQLMCHYSGNNYEICNR